MLNDSNDINDIDQNSGKNVAKTVFIGLAAVIIIATGGYFVGKSMGWFSGNTGVTKANSISYTTNERIEIKKKPDLNSATVTILRENSVVSGVIVKSNGTDWVEINTVDGDYGFVQLSDLTKIVENSESNKLNPGQYKLVTSNDVYLRSSPSLSGKVIGVAEGGTRLVSDGTIKSENETWYRLQFGNNTLAYVMGRFTTPDDERSSANSGLSANGQIGVLAYAKSITNVQATPFEGSRIVRSLLINDPVNIIGQTLATQWWYIVRLSDGAQGFVLRDTISVPQSSYKWMYADGTEAPGPNIPQSKSANTSSNSASNTSTESSSVEVPLAPQEKDEEIVVITKDTEIPVD